MVDLFINVMLSLVCEKYVKCIRKWEDDLYLALQYTFLLSSGGFFTHFYSLTMKYKRVVSDNGCMQTPI